LAPIIIQAIKGVVSPHKQPRCLVFPILIGQIICKKGVDVSGAWILKTFSKDIGDDNKLIIFNYSFNVHWWSNLNRLTKDSIKLLEEEVEEANEEAAIDEEDKEQGQASIPTFMRPKPGRALSQVQFQNQVFDWIARQDKIYEELKVHVEDIREAQLTDSAKMDKILKLF